MVSSIRADPAVLQVLRQIVAAGGAGQDTPSVGAIEGERQLNVGGRAKPQPAGGHGEIVGDNTFLQDVKDETAVNDYPSSFVQSSSANNDHQYFNSAFTSPASPSSSILFSSSNPSFDFESILQPQPVSDLFSVNDTADIQQYFTSSPPSIGLNIVDSTSSVISNAISAKSPNSVVPTSPALIFDPDFPQIGDDILEQALKSLGDLTKFAENTTALASITDQNISGNGFDFIQSDDYTDLAWEESFAQLFPSLPNA